ncbi:MAG: nicotinate phosphoribosyltransferase [Candidatus Thorarchaeota archaeon]|jgi:nicotinamide phosphoribosyltransferase
MSILLLTDSYKLSHYKQYPPGTSKVYSYFESRIGAKYPETVFFGLQYYLKKYLEGIVVTEELIEEAKSLAEAHMGGTSGTFNEAGWRYILEKHGGRLPVSIRAVPEGLAVPTSNVLMTIENTDPECYWLPNYLETLLVMVWYPSTVATISRHVRDLITKGSETSSDTLDGVPFKLHDFGFRGSTSVESAGIGGLAHLVNFMGTDTIAALTCGRKYYHADMAGFSIPASEHSTMTSWGEYGEVEAFRNMLDQYATGLVACVSDSYDIDRACSETWGKHLKDKVLSRDGTLVVRPDSGEIVPMVLNVLNRLGDAFGTYQNSKGFRVLDDHVRVIQGDGCTPETIQAVIDAMIRTGWSVDNVAFGMGGGLLQRLNRDTQRFAFKCSSVIVDGKEKGVFKRPSSDPSKNSKRGRLALVRDFSGYDTVPENTARANVLNEVFRDGEVLVDQSLEEVRSRS